MNIFPIPVPLKLSSPQLEEETEVNLSFDPSLEQKSPKGVAVSLVETEQVLVVPTGEFQRVGYFQGFTAEVDRYLPELLQSKQICYRPRGAMEENPGFKQLIPYVVFRYVDRDDQVHIFQYCRGKGQGEARLRAKRSVGVGGHISTIDADAVSNGSRVHIYEQGLKRELHEEVEIQTEYDSRCVGLINDDETEVGKVHLGVVHLYDLEQPAVRPREPDILDARFLPVFAILDDLEQFESWSRIVVKALFA